MPRIVVIGGPTASGKSASALHLAEHADDDVVGEIIGADSRQLYRGLPIASAAPTADEKARVPHHLYESFDATDATLTAGVFVERCDDVVRAVLARGHRAIIVGGTGLYLRAFRQGLDDDAPADDTVRARLMEELARDGLAALVSRLSACGQDIAHVDVNNPVRVVRALEIVLCGGVLRPVDALLQRSPRALAADAAFIMVDSVDLDARIQERSRAMFGDDAIVAEATALAQRLPTGHALLDTIGVKEALELASGVVDVEGAIAQTALRTRQYAKRQRTWFKKEPWWSQWSRRSSAS